ncbi:MAG: PilN domain-containing protein [Anaerolineae bacterium]|nr:PilN domain-containing protein [Anaerolineae bacterium]
MSFAPNPEPEPEVEQTEPTGKRSRRIALWLAIFGISALFLPLFVINSTITTAEATLQPQLDSFLATLTATPAIAAEFQAISDELLEARSQIAILENVSATLIAAQIDWPQIMVALRNYDAETTHLSTFSHENGHIVITGEASAESVVIDYAARLDYSGYFGRVAVQSITRRPAPTATPVPTNSQEVVQSTAPLLFAFTINLDLESDNATRQSP